MEDVNASTSFRKIGNVHWSAATSADRAGVTLDGSSYRVSYLALARDFEFRQGDGEWRSCGDCE